MKALKLSTLLVVLSLISVSCVENSDKYKAVVAQRDSLSTQVSTLETSYNQTLEIINDVESGFASISQKASQVHVDMKGVEGKQVSKRELIAAQMTAVKEEMELNRAKIEELRKISSKYKNSNATLEATIKRLQTEMEAKDEQIRVLQAELQQKNIKIDELNTTVSTQSKNIAEQQSAIEQQKSTISTQDANLHKVSYCVGTSKALKKANVLSSGGLFQPKKVLNNNFDASVFTVADQRSLSSIPTNSKTAKIMSSHPQGSYSLDVDAEKKITIKISNPEKFWSVSKYLVVQI